MSCAWADQMTSAKPSNSARTALKLLPQKQPARHTTEFFKNGALLNFPQIITGWASKDGLCTMLLGKGSTHYEPIGWDEAALIAAQLNKLDSPNEAVFTRRSHQQRSSLTSFPSVNSVRIIYQTAQYVSRVEQTR